MIWDRICRLLGIAGVALFIATAFTPLAHFLDEWTATPSQIVPSDAIVVLGEAVFAGGILAPESAFAPSVGSLSTDKGSRRSWSSWAAENRVGRRRPRSVLPSRASREFRRMRSSPKRGRAPPERKRSSSRHYSNREQSGRFCW